MHKGAVLRRVDTSFFVISPFKPTVGVLRLRPSAAAHAAEIVPLVTTTSAPIRDYQTLSSSDQPSDLEVSLQFTSPSQPLSPTDFVIYLNSSLSSASAPLGALDVRLESALSTAASVSRYFPCKH